jgi:hypothetical protein
VSATANTPSLVRVGDLDDHLPGAHDLAGIGARRQHDAVRGRDELGIPQLILGESQPGLRVGQVVVGSLQLLFGLLVLLGVVTPLDSSWR